MDNTANDYTLTTESVVMEDNPALEVITDPLAQAVILHVKDGMLNMYTKNLNPSDTGVVLVGALETARAEMQEAEEAAAQEVAE